MHPILKLVAQRLALGLLLLLAASVLIFIGTQILPGDVAAAILGQGATEQALANMRADLGLDRPAITRYLSGFSMRCRVILASPCRMAATLPKALPAG